jgi:hypothetical protein
MMVDLLKATKSQKGKIKIYWEMMKKMRVLFYFGL